MDFTKFLSIKSQLQRLYNFKAKEEREIIYAVKIEEEHKTKDDGEIPTTRASIEEEIHHDLIAITTIKNHFYLEYLRVAKDITFKYSTSLSLLIKIAVNSKDEVSLKISERNLDVKFTSEHCQKEFTWCIIHLFPFIQLDSAVQVKGVNYKDLEEYAIKNKFFSFNKIFEGDIKKEKYEVDISDYELEALKFYAILC